MLAMGAITMEGGSPLPLEKRMNKSKSKDQPRSDSMSVSSKEYSFVEIMSLSKSPSSATSSIKEHSIKVTKPSKPTRSTTPPPIFFPKAGPSTATKITKRLDSQPIKASSQHAQREAKIGAIRKVMSQCLVTAQKATKTGDGISVHMIKYLTSVEPRSESLGSLAHTYLDTCRILIDIEQGLHSSLQDGRLLNPSLLEDLQKIIKSTTAELIHVDGVLAKSLDHEKKGLVGRKMKISRGKGGTLGKDFDKLAANLAKHMGDLREGIEGLPWTDETLGPKMIPAGKGFGYTGLAAALDRLYAVSSPVVERPAIAVGVHLGDLSATVSRDLRLNSSNGQPEMPTCPLPSLPTHRHKRSSSFARTGTAIDSRFSSTTAGSNSQWQHRSFMSNGTEDHLRTENDPDDFVNDLGAPEIISPSVIRINVDPATVQRYTPRNINGFDKDHHKGTLISVIRQRDRRLVNTLLDRGVPPAASDDAHPLNEAIAVNDEEIVRQLLLFGADPDESDINAITPLHAAITANHLPCAVNLLKFRADPHLAAGADLCSPLARAVTENVTAFAHILFVYGGNVRHLTRTGETLLIATINAKTPKRAVELILDYGGELNAKSRDGRTALYKAIAANRADLVGLLLERGASPNLPGPNHMLWGAVDKPECLQLMLSQGADPKRAPGILEFATSMNGVEGVRMLLKAGADPNSKSGIDTPLCTAIRDNRQDIFQLLVSHNADPNLQADMHPTTKCIMHHRTHFLPILKAAGADFSVPRGLLENAVACRNMDALKWLLDNGLNPNDRTLKGDTPLTTAIRDNRLDMVEQLLKHGADPNVRGHDFPLCLAVRHPLILKKLLKVIHTVRAYNGVLEMAVAANQLDSVKTLLKAGVSVEEKNAGIFTPLTTAIRDDHIELVHFLLSEAKANVNAPGEHLPLVIAVRGYVGSTDMVRMLLEMGADPNLKHRGLSAAMAAIELGNLEVLESLCECSRNGVDWEIENGNGKNLMDLVQGKGWKEAVGVLMKAQRRTRW